MRARDFLSQRAKGKRARNARRETAFWVGNSCRCVIEDHGVIKDSGLFWGKPELLSSRRFRRAMPRHAMGLSGSKG
jgi:hypothetical protein